MASWFTLKTSYHAGSEGGSRQGRIVIVQIIIFVEVDRVVPYPFRKIVCNLILSRIRTNGVPRCLTSLTLFYPVIRNSAYKHILLIVAVESCSQNICSSSLQPRTSSCRLTILTFEGKPRRRCYIIIEAQRHFFAQETISTALLATRLLVIPPFSAKWRNILKWGHLHTVSQAYPFKWTICSGWGGTGRESAFETWF